MSRIGRTEGRRLFGLDPLAYDAARPGHADRVYDLLVERCGLGPGSSVLEVGPGTGQATRRLLDAGAAPLVALEPDGALSAFLRERFGDRIDVRETTLEEALLPPGSFDLAIAASSFHWVEEDVGLERISGALRVDGWLAMWWTLFGDADESDAFISATSPLLEDLDSSPTDGQPGRPQHARDREARLGALETAGFQDIGHELVKWRASWDADGIRTLYGTFSPIARLGDERREELLDEIARIARDDFGGRVERTLVTSVYTARKADRRAGDPTVQSGRGHTHDAADPRGADLLGRRSRGDRRVQVDGPDRPRPLRGPPAVHRALALVRRDQPANARRAPALARDGGDGPAPQLPGVAAARRVRAHPQGTGAAPDRPRDAAVRPRVARLRAARPLGALDHREEEAPSG